jgi:Holliday junction resolvase
MTEREWQAQVTELLTRHGWLCYHTWNPIHSPAGFPDIVAVRDNRILAIELKVGGRQPTPKQREWLRALEGVKVVDAFVCRPAADLSALEELVA